MAAYSRARLTPAGTYDIFARLVLRPGLTCTLQRRERVFDALILHQWSVAKGLTSGNSAARRQLKCNLRVRSRGDVGRRKARQEEFQRAFRPANARSRVSRRGVAR